MQVVGRGDLEIARVAAAQRRLATRGQLRAAGLGRGAIAHRVKNGWLHERLPGVFRVGPDVGEPWADETAAVLYLDGHAVLSHRTAAALWGFAAAHPREVIVTIVGRDARSRSGLVLHRTTHLDWRDLRAREGLPVTAPARTLIDFAGDADADELEEAMAIGQMRGLVSGREIELAIERAPRRRGVALLRRLLQSEGTGYTRSWGERRMRALLRKANLPLPLVNVPLQGFTVDFFWPESKLVVEVDGYEFHGDRRAFERDRRKDQILVAAGYRVVRITLRQLREEPLAVLARLAQALVLSAA